ncbi:MAG: DUF4070 domain-containing protein [Elusimicrobia bacterium]|nr:DUF4070 domain-containing protein [Elusimicrobiota bacterium]
MKNENRGRKSSAKKILLVYPSYPVTFWSFKYALKFVSKKATHPPLGLLTVAAILPDEWDKRLVDMNVSNLEDGDLDWADYVFVSAMSVQKASVEDVIDRCRQRGKPIVAGGPLFTIEHKYFDNVDYLVLNEAEVTLPLFLKDLESGKPRHVYTSNELPDIRKTPPPRWELIDMKKYASMNIQYSRGCPFNCDFCDIPLLYGHKVRTKTDSQILTELESLYSRGWRGRVFFVDDNFIGNKRKLKNGILPAIAGWMRKRRFPFVFNTEVSVNLADDEELMRMMVKAGFAAVFVGIETPDEASLAECNKFQNKNRDLVACVKKIQKFGLEVQGGFIVGFDSDTSSTFERLITFIRKSRIVTAMVGLLSAPPGTKLYQRLASEGRILKFFSGNNTDFSTNFIPKMPFDALVDGYKKIIGRIYSPKCYYERVRDFLKEYKPLAKSSRFDFSNIKAFFKSVFSLGLGRDRQMRYYYWRLFFWSLFRRPRVFPLAITFAIYGYHFQKVFERYIYPA